MKKPQLGIMTLYLNNKYQIEEKQLFAKLIKLAKSIGFNAFVFTPGETNGAARKVYAHVYNPTLRQWSRKWMDFPDIIFDRCRFQPTPRFQQLKRFRAKYPNLLYMNRPMANKWITYQILNKSPQVAPYLPSTQLFTDQHTLMQMLNRKQTVYIKPINGTGGRGIIRIAPIGANLFEVQGRDLQRRMMRTRKVNAVTLNKLLQPIRKERRNIMQQGINTRLPNGRVHDFRALVQKNGEGIWEVTGIAGRVGPAGSITSNLHGGGRAMSVDDLLSQQFSNKETVEKIKQQMNETSIIVVKALEKKFQDLCEMALDIAVDRSGRIWLLEVNPKPAREVFARLGEQATYQKALKRPLEYALWLYKQKTR